MRETIQHPLLRQLYDYWMKLRGERRFPLRGEFDPTALPRLLAYLVVNDVELGPDGKPRFRIRLEGDHVVRARGYSAKGRYLDEPGVLVLDNNILLAYGRIVATGEPWYTEGAFTGDEIRAGRIYRLALPFGGESADRVDFIIVGLVHETGPLPAA